MSLEYTRVGCNNWQGYSATGPLYNVFPANQDRATRIVVFKSITFFCDGRLDTNLKLKSG